MASNVPETLRLNRQFRYSSKYFASKAKNGVVSKVEPGVHLYWTYCDLSFINATFISCPITDDTSWFTQLEIAKATAAQVNPMLPWFLFIESELLSEDLRERSRILATERGFTYVDASFCMQASSLKDPVRPLPAVETIFLTTAQDICDAVTLNMDSYGVERAETRSALAQNAFYTDQSKEICCLIKVDGISVATAMTMIMDECLYINWVATAAAHRNVRAPPIDPHLRYDRLFV
jgi:hypothetical protein